MKRIWSWFGDNASQLQGLAAVAAIVAALAAVPYFLSKWFRPELIVKLTRTSSTTPVVLEEWIRRVAVVFRTLPDPPEGNPDPYRSLRELQDLNVLDAISGASRPTRLQVDITNQSDRVIPGVRLRLDRARPIWGVNLVATFLTADEVAAWQKRLPEGTAERTTVLPELPPLPPRSAAAIVAYGDVADADLSLPVPGASFKLISTVEVEDRGLVATALRPSRIVFFLGLLPMALTRIIHEKAEHTKASVW